MVANTTLSELVSVAPQNNKKSAQLFFHNAYDQVVKTIRFGENDDLDAVLPATNPSKMGSTFLKWVFEGTENEATEEAIKAQMSATETVVIHIRPLYEVNGEVYTVRVTYGGEELKVLQTNLGETIQVTKSEVVSWSNGALTWDMIKAWQIDGKIVSYGDQYTILSAKSGEIELVVLTEAGDPKPVVNITQQYASMNGDYYRLSTTLKYNVPSGFTVREAGFVYSSDSSYADNLDGLLIDAPNTKKHIASNTTPDVTYTLNINTKTPGRIYYIKAFVSCTDASGNVVTTYSDPVVNSYNSLNQ